MVGAPYAEPDELDEVDAQHRFRTRAALRVGGEPDVMASIGAVAPRLDLVRPIVGEVEKMRRREVLARGMGELGGADQRRDGDGQGRWRQATRVLPAVKRCQRPV